MIVIGLLMLMGITTVLINGCAKDGATGPAGSTGSNGTSGTNGTNGKDGNANVKSASYTIAPSNWVHVGTNGSSGDGFKAVLSVPNITNSIITDGIVLCYFSFGSTYSPMPVTMPLYSGGVTSLYTFTYATNILQVEQYDSDWNTVKPASNMNIKIVTIAGSALISHPEINIKDYEKVKAAFNMND